MPQTWQPNKDLEMAFGPEISATTKATKRTGLADKLFKGAKLPSKIGAFLCPSCKQRVQNGEAKVRGCRECQTCAMKATNRSIMVKSTYEHINPLPDQTMTVYKDDKVGTRRDGLGFIQTPFAKKPIEFDPPLKQEPGVILAQQLEDYQSLMMRKKQFVLPRQTVTAYSKVRGLNAEVSKTMTGGSETLSS